MRNLVNVCVCARAGGHGGAVFRTESSGRWRARRRSHQPQQRPHRRRTVVITGSSQWLVPPPPPPPVTGSRAARSPRRRRPIRPRLTRLSEHRALASLPRPPPAPSPDTTRTPARDAAPTVPPGALTVRRCESFDSLTHRPLQPAFSYSRYFQGALIYRGVYIYILVGNPEMSNPIENYHIEYWILFSLPCLHSVYQYRWKLKSTTP